MNTISYDHFYKLKLGDFIPNKEEIETIEEWEFMNSIWHGECLGFSEWLYHNDEPNVRSISLDFSDLSNATINEIASSLNLEITKGMSKEEIVKTFGHPQNEVSYTSDRTTYEYIIGSAYKYYLSLTIDNEEGLDYLVLMNQPQTITDLEQKSLNQ